MGQIISVNATTGEFLLPCFTFEADSFATGLAYNTTGLEVQVATNDGTLYRYTVGEAITNNVAPANNTEIGFAQLDGTNGWVVKLQVHTSVFSSLDIAAGESIGIIAMKATGYAPVVGTLAFAKPVATDASGYVRLSSDGLASVTAWTVNITGNLSGSVGSVTGAVGSVTGAVGSVTGNIGGNVNGNVSGSVGSVTGAVGSVTGAVGSVTGNVGGSVASVTGAVGSVTGNVGGDVSGKVIGSGAGTITGDGVRAASVTGAVGSVTGAVGSVTGNIGGNVAGSVGSVTNLSADWADGGRLDLLIDAIKAKTDNALQVGTAYIYTNNATGSGFDNVTITVAP